MNSPSVRECVPEVAALLMHAPIGPDNIAEAKVPSQRIGGWVCAIIQNMGVG